MVVLSATTSFAQTAADFTSNDCASSSHHLFADLDAGKVIVLVWVMPCGACVGQSLTANNVVASYATSNPNTVFMYLCDDFGNTSCSSLSSWATSNGITGATAFSDASISQSSYGTAGMPKIVVLAGSSHTIFLNQNNSLLASTLEDAINSALSSTGISESNTSLSSLAVFPNPASSSAEIKFTLVKNSDLTIELFNLQGKKIKNIFTGNRSAGENIIALDYTGIDSGMYLVHVSDGEKSKFINVVIGK